MEAGLDKSPLHHMCTSHHYITCVQVITTSHVCKSSLHVHTHDYVYTPSHAAISHAHVSTYVRPPMQLYHMHMFLHTYAPPMQLYHMHMYVSTGVRPPPMQLYHMHMFLQTYASRSIKCLIKSPWPSNM